MIDIKIFAQYLSRIWGNLTCNWKLRSKWGGGWNNKRWFREGRGGGIPVLTQIFSTYLKKNQGFGAVDFFSWLPAPRLLAPKAQNIADSWIKLFCNVPRVIKKNICFHKLEQQHIYRVSKPSIFIAGSRLRLRNPEKNKTALQGNSWIKFQGINNFISLDTKYFEFTF